MTAEPRCWGGGVSHPSQLTTGLVIKSVTTSPTLAGERMLFILQVSILSEQTKARRDFSTSEAEPETVVPQQKNNSQSHIAEKPKNQKEGATHHTDCITY